MFAPCFKRKIGAWFLCDTPMLRNLGLILGLGLLFGGVQASAQTVRAFAWGKGINGQLGNEAGGDYAAAPVATRVAPARVSPSRKSTTRALTPMRIISGW